VFDAVLERVLDANRLEEAFVVDFHFRSLAHARGVPQGIPVSLLAMNPRTVIETFEDGVYCEEVLHRFDSTFRRGYLPVRKKGGRWGVLCLEVYDPYYVIFRRLNAALWISLGLAGGASLLLAFTALALIRRFERLYLETLRAQRLASIGQVAAHLAHEIKNPLGIILSTAQFLRKRVPEGEKRVVEDICEEVRRMNDQVEGVLDLARETPMQVSPEDPAGLLTGILRLFGAKASEHQINLREEIDTDLPRIRVDRNKFRQILLNILLNALEASASGGTITVRAYRGEATGLVMIDITDTGEGMTKQRIREVLSEPFASSRPSGTGLGLFLSRQLVLRHGGTFSITSELGQGTTVHLSFPCT
jgi:signal transduction histidine kinase